MTIAKSLNSGIYVKTDAIATDPAPQLSRNYSISKTVGGVACSLTFVHYAGCGIVKFTVDGVDWVSTPLKHGQGIQWAHNLLRPGEVVAWNPCSPTQGGSQRDGTLSISGTSNPYYAAVSLDGTRTIQRTNGANWGAPGQITGGGLPAWNDRLVGALLTTQDINWGYGGNDRIIQFLTDVVVPNTALTAQASALDFVCCSVYPTTALFGTIEYLNPATGATRAYPGFPDTSQTEIVMVSSADGTKCIGTYQPLTEWGATGYAQEIDTAGLSNMFIRCREVYTVGTVPPGTRRFNAFMIFGTRAQFISDVMALDALHITRSTDIVLPDVA